MSKNNNLHEQQHQILSAKPNVELVQIEFMQSNSI